MEKVMLSALLANRTGKSWQSFPVSLRLPTDQPAQLQNACTSILKSGMVGSSHGPVKVTRPYKHGSPNYLLYHRGVDVLAGRQPWWILQIVGWEITTREYRGEQRFDARASGLFCLASSHISIEDILGVSIRDFSMRMRPLHYLKRKK